MARGAAILLVLTLGATLAASCGAAKVVKMPAQIDKGTDRPPNRLTDNGKSIWMTEWSACWRVPLTHLSNVLNVHAKPGETPQQTAKRLANRAVYLLYETRPETRVAADGCRNGILWRYYNPANNH